MKEIIILALILIPLASAITEETICDKAFFLLIDGKEMEQLRDKVGNVSEEYMINYASKCSDFRKLPFSIKETNITSNETECDYILDKKIIWESYNLNQSIGSPLKFHLGNTSCDSIQKWKWVFNVENSDGRFSFAGIRLWWVVLLIILIPTLSLFRASRRVDNETYDELKKEPKK